MLHMTTTDESPLLAPDEGPAAHVLNAHGAAPAVLVCEHASRFIPAALDGLGLGDEVAKSHAAWDIGALDLAKALMQMLDTPLVAARVSRLVYDCNRPPESSESIPVQSEIYHIPGNTGLSEGQISARVRDIYTPFRDLAGQVLDQHPTPPMLITIHSFTPVYNGQSRPVELGILHDEDDRLARALLGQARQRTGLRTEMNQPYSAADGVTHTLRDLAGRRGLANVMIELRNDLIDTPDGVSRIAGLLGPVLNDVIREFAGTGEKKHKQMTGRNK